VQTFRREESPEASARLRLCRLDSNATYAFTNLDLAGVTEMTGRELLESGLPIRVPDRPGAAIITYAKKVLAVNRLNEQPLMASPAVAGDAFFIRTEKYLYRVEETTP